VLVALAATPVAADTQPPLFWIDTVEQTQGFKSEVALDFLFAAGATPERVAITVPRGYAVALPAFTTDPAVLTVEATDASGNDQSLFGEVSAADSTPQIAADLATCAPGTHTATWSAKLTRDAATVLVPIAVDQASDGTTIFTLCLDDLHRQSLRPLRISFDDRTGFTNPPTLETYVWDALLTPYDAAGAPSPRSAYELRADARLPEGLTIAATYAQRTHKLVVQGKLQAADLTSINVMTPRSHVEVQILALVSGNVVPLGTATTGQYGGYTFAKKLAKAPAHLFGFVDVYFWVPCYAPAASTAPAGCPGQTESATTSATIRPVIKKAPVKKRRTSS
jgi:hypothetical protein